ncbi:MAG: cation:H+ antiporter [Pseudorhodobacter sp.]|jgi:cation:H+ antiporter
MLEFSTYDIGVLATGAIVAGIWLLVLGGNWTINAAVAIAQRAKLSRMFIGATIIAFGTSVPELFTSVNANIQGFPGISLGNVVGSNIANILMVIGASALVCTLAVKPGEVKRDLAIMMLATAILVAGMLYGIFTLWMGLAMFGLLAAFVVWQYANNEINTSEIEDIEMTAAQAGFYVVIGIATLAVGSELLVRGAVTAGNVLGVPEAIIGLTAVAIGTSLPELTASIAAAMKRETDMMFGNIIGSNTFNVLSIVGLTAITKPLVVDPVIADFDMWFMVGVSAGFAAMLLAGVRITRPIGVAFLAAYLAFTVYQFSGMIAA